MKKNKQIEENIVYTDFRESIIFDSGAPIFVSKHYYTTANTLEGFQTCFSHMSETFLQTENIDSFKSLFKQAAKHYGYPKEEAQKVLTACVDRMIKSRSVALTLYNL